MEVAGNLKCPKCQVSINLQEVLEGVEYSWPEISQVWFKCPKCKEGSHAEITNGSAETGNYFPMEQNWETLSKVKDVNIVTRQDPEYFHVWYKGKHFEFKKR